MSRRRHEPLRKGSRREGIIEPDAPPIFHSGPINLEWQAEVAPQPEQVYEECPICEASGEACVNCEDSGLPGYVEHDC